MSKVLKPRVVVGTYKLGDFYVDLYAEFDNQNGSIEFAPSKESHPIVRVGCCWDWKNVVGVLVHEALEFILTVERLRLRSCDGWGQNHAEYIFHFDHHEFTRASDKLGHFLAEVMVPMRAEYDKRNEALKKAGKPQLGE